MRDAERTGPMRDAERTVAAMSGGAHTPELAHVAGPDVTEDEAVGAVTARIAEHVPSAWREAAVDGGPAAVRRVRTTDDYRAWYPVYGRSGLVAPG
jgi:hypothetical protein